MHTQKSTQNKVKGDISVVFLSALLLVFFIKNTRCSLLWKGKRKQCCKFTVSLSTF